MVYGHDDMTYHIGEVARLAGVTIRTLHHCDEIGLLRPGGRSDTGYRLYGDADLARLQQVLQPPVELTQLPTRDGPSGIRPSPVASCS